MHRIFAAEPGLSCTVSRPSPCRLQASQPVQSSAAANSRTICAAGLISRIPATALPAGMVVVEKSRTPARTNEDQPVEFVKHTDCSFTLDEEVEICRIISHKLTERAPFSLIRLGDGEGVLMSIAHDSPRSDFQYLAKHRAGWNRARTAAGTQRPANSLGYRGRCHRNQERYTECHFRRVEFRAAGGCFPQEIPRCIRS